MHAGNRSETVPATRKKNRVNNRCFSFTSCWQFAVKLGNLIGMQMSSAQDLETNMLNLGLIGEGMLKSQQLPLSCRMMCHHGKGGGGKFTILTINHLHSFKACLTTI